MDNAWLWLYLFTRLDPLHTFFVVIAGFSGFMLFLGGVGLVVNDDIGKFFASQIRRAVIGLSMGLLFILAVPTKSDMALILGGHFGLQAATSEPVTETADKVYRMIQKELDARLEETNEPEKEE